MYYSYLGPDSEAAINYSHFHRITPLQQFIRAQEEYQNYLFYGEHVLTEECRPLQAIGALRKAISTSSCFSLTGSVNSGIIKSSAINLDSDDADVPSNTNEESAADSQTPLFLNHERNQVVAASKEALLKGAYTELETWRRIHQLNSRGLPRHTPSAHASVSSQSPTITAVSIPMDVIALAEQLLPMPDGTWPSLGSSEAHTLGKITNDDQIPLFATSPAKVPLSTFEHAKLYDHFLTSQHLALSQRYLKPFLSSLKLTQAFKMTSEEFTCFEWNKQSSSDPLPQVSGSTCPFTKDDIRRGLSKFPGTRRMLKKQMDSTTITASPPHRSTPTVYTIDAVEKVSGSNEPPVQQPIQLSNTSSAFFDKFKTNNKCINDINNECTPTKAQQPQTSLQLPPRHSVQPPNTYSFGHVPAPSVSSNSFTASSSAAPSAGGFISAQDQLSIDIKQGRVNPANLPPSMNGNKRLGMRRPFTPPIASPQSPSGDNTISADKILSATCGNKENGQNGKQKNSGDEEGGIPSFLLLEDGSIPRQLEGLDPKLVAHVAHEILEKGTTNISFDDIAGLKHAKTTIEEAIVWPLTRPDLFVGLRDPPRGLLLFGPPGTGKTMIARAIASRAKCTFMNISASSLMSKWVGDGEKLVRCMFAVAAVRQPSVIFIDEIDSLLSMRSDGEMDAVRRVKTEFLVQMDGVATNASERVLLIGATNRPEELDEAARRRMEKRLYIPLPDDAARIHLITHLITQFSHSLTEADFTKIATDTEGYSGADLRILCREASLGPLRKMKKTPKVCVLSPSVDPSACREIPINAADISNMDIASIRPIDLKDFKHALKMVRPSVGPNELIRYESWNNTYGSSDSAGNYDSSSNSDSDNGGL